MDKLIARIACVVWSVLARCLFVMLTLSVKHARGTEGELLDYCLTERFEPSCPADDVIVVQEARYGRMRVGRCVLTNFGFVGCQVEVLDVMDRKCSGRRTCVVPVPEPLLEERKPCNQEFKSYLETKYTCVSVISTNGQHCQSGTDVTIKEKQGFLSNTITERTGCGSETSPWKIEAQSGQKINFTLFDYMWTASDSAHVNMDLCPLYAIITESGTGQKCNVCGKRGRESNIYMTVTNSVEVKVMRQYNEENRAYFMIKFEVVGCVDPILPGNARLKREGDVATIVCDGEDRTWEVRCHNNQWLGTIGNCSSGHGSPLPSKHTRLLSLPMDVAIVIIAGVAFVIGAIIFVIGLYIIRRRHFAAPRGPPSTYVYRDDDPNKPAGNRPEEDWKLTYQIQNKSQGIYMQTSDTGSANENEYAYVWDTAPSPPGVSFVQSQEGANVEKRTNFRETVPASRACAVLDPRQSNAGNTNAHDGQYEKRLPTNMGLDSVYERGPKPHPPQYFELDQFDPQKGSSKD